MLTLDFHTLPQCAQQSESLPFESTLKHPREAPLHATVLQTCAGAIFQHQSTDTASGRLQNATQSTGFRFEVWIHVANGIIGTSLDSWLLSHGK